MNKLNYNLACCKKDNYERKKNTPSNDVIFSGSTIHPVLTSIGATSIAEILTNIITPAYWRGKLNGWKPLGTN